MRVPPARLTSHYQSVRRIATQLNAAARRRVLNFYDDTNADEVAHGARKF